jgi:YfiH family protein
MQFQLFEPYRHKLFCEISNRHGGVSPKPYDTLNVALHVGDNPINVLKNRTILADEYDFLIENLIYMDQTHSDNIQIIEHTGFNKIENCDAIITNQSNIPLMVMVADCIPAMLYDPKNSVIAAVHAGRNGTFKSIITKTIQKMKENFGTHEENINVAMGPGIRPCCYEVSDDLADITKKSFGKKYIQKREGKNYLDLQTLNFDQLLQYGIPEKNIEISPVCTCCNENYFSYRREGVTGRFCGIIKLK